MPRSAGGGGPEVDGEGDVALVGGREAPLQHARRRVHLVALRRRLQTQHKVFTVQVLVHVWMRLYVAQIVRILDIHIRYVDTIIV